MIPLNAINKAKNLKNEAMRYYYRNDFINAIKKLEEAKKIINLLITNSALDEMTEVYKKIDLHYSALIDKISREKNLQSIRKTKVSTKNMTDTNQRFEIDNIECQQFLVNIQEDLNFNYIAGLDEVKLQFREFIEYPLKYPDLVEKYDFSVSNGILLYGPPGCGKTYIIACASGEFNIPVFKLTGSTILSKYVGESPKMIQQIYECAENNAPSVVLIDEIDKLITKNDTSGVIM